MFDNETVVTNIFVLMKTENLLIGRAKELRGDLQTASEDIDSLHEKLGKNFSIQAYKQLSYRNVNTLLYT